MHAQAPPLTWIVSSPRQQECDAQCFNKVVASWTKVVEDIQTRALQGYSIAKLLLNDTMKVRVHQRTSNEEMLSPLLMIIPFSASAIVALGFLRVFTKRFDQN